MPFVSMRKALFVTAVMGGFALCPSSAIAEESETTGTEVTITDKARTHFKAGVNLLQDPAGARYDEAYQQFKAAYAESPSWKILGNLGLAAMHLERYGEAIEAFSGYLKQGGDEVVEQEREQFQRDLETLQASVAEFAITAPPNAEIVDLRSSNQGADVRNYYVVPESGVLSIGVRPGQHVVTATIDGEEAGRWSVRIEAQQREEHTFSNATSVAAPPPEEPATPEVQQSRVPAYVALGVGVVGIGAGTTFLAIRGNHTKKAGDEYDGCNESLDCGTTERQSVEARDKKAATMGTLSLISYGVGVAGIGTGIALLLMGNDSGERPLEAKVGGVVLSPFSGAHHIGVAGTF